MRVQAHGLQCLPQNFSLQSSSVVYAGVASPKLQRVPLSDSQLTIGELDLSATVPRVKWILGIQTQVFTIICQVLFLLGHLPSLPPL